VSLFTHRTREPWVGVYHPHTNSGTVHVADPAELPTHKVWSWGYDRDAMTWREALSDDNSAYVELQAGLFRNQETYAFLEPQESVRFTEYWLPVRNLGGISRANQDAIIHAEHTPAGTRIALDVTREITDVRITSSGTVLAQAARLSPKDTWRIELPAKMVSIAVLDGSGATLIDYSDLGGPLSPIRALLPISPEDAARIGPQANDRPSRATAKSSGDFVEAGTLDELEGRRLTALATYRAGLERFPNSFDLLKAAGRLAVALGQAKGLFAEQWLKRPTLSPIPPSEPLRWLRAAHAKNTTDAEVQYYLGLAEHVSKFSPGANPEIESALRFRRTAPAAAMLSTSVDGAMRLGWPKAVDKVDIVQRALLDAPRASALGAREVSLLRRSGRRDEALARARYWKTVDPTDSILRYELTRLGEADPDLWPHLAADANRVLDVADHYLAIRATDDAHAVLDYRYPSVAPPMREPGAVPPQDSPLVAYYRAALRPDGIPEADHRRARELSAAYVFPNRRSSYVFLVNAIVSNPDDHQARSLLGSLYLSSGLVDQAIGEWQAARAAKPPIPTLHRNLGLTLLHGKADLAGARTVLEEGLGADPNNVEVYLTLDGVLSASNAAPRDRAAALRRFPSLDRAPSSLVFKLALALAEAGQAAEAERLFHDRFFAREEGGTNVRAVYAQVRLTSARRAADAKDCRAALAIVDTLPAERQDLAFTRGTLADALQPATMARQLAAIEGLCGRPIAAKPRWQRLAGPLESGGAPLAVAVADDARARLGRPRTPAQRTRLEAALASATATLESGGSSNPGSLEYARGLLFAALGRTKEARQALQHVFILPDRNLSHSLARAALREVRTQ
jgi:tetratricopeptide (TPR) repeat protein